MSTEHADVWTYRRTGLLHDACVMYHTVPMMTLGETSRAEMAERIAQWERETAGPVANDRLLEKLDKLRGWFPEYFTLDS